MKLEFIQPHAELKPYVSKIWLFENATGFAHHGTLIAPNARPKIILSYRNVLTTTDHAKTARCVEHDIYFIGIRDVPVTLGTAARAATGCIGLELTTGGAYRFLNAPMHAVTNNLFSFSELYGKSGKELLREVADAESPGKKIALVQEFLVQQLDGSFREHPIVTYALRLIASQHGLVPIKELERKTGYSKRYLDLLFKDHLGISPKTYATIMRFQRYYKSMEGVGYGAARESMLDLYYDQSHFIKEFKRYTGYTPQQYGRVNNDFGKEF